jgi:GNAT superfamily N-acetyltransferase
VVRDINKTVGRRWQEIDPLLPGPQDLAPGCADPFLANGRTGRPAGFAACRHDEFGDDTLTQTWGTRTRFALALRVRDKDTGQVVDDLLGQWHEHIAGLPQAHQEDTSALVNWPSRETSGILALQRHGLAPMTILAARPAGQGGAGGGAGAPARTAIRPAGIGDLDTVAAMEIGVIRYDGQFGGSIWRPATERLVRAEARSALENGTSLIWIAEQAGQGGAAVGMVAVTPPASATWVAPMTALAPAAYLATMFVRPPERGSGIGAALVRHAHAELDKRGITVTLLHYALVNPVSGPFWSRMGYRPLWTTWEARPAAALR